MALSSIRMAVVSGTFLAFVGSSLLAGPTRPNSIERFGIGGYLQPIGLHHGFHIERIAPDSAAEKDRLQLHDVIVKVDGEPIRSLDHLRAVLAEAFADDGVVTISYLRNGSLIHHDLHCNVKKVTVKAARAGKAAKKSVPDPDDVEIR
jgi:membrane-associated protease RseP (regulator of RpoE activity)